LEDDRSDADLIPMAFLLHHNERYYLLSA
jgi:hypothetical protein